MNVHEAVKFSASLTVIDTGLNPKENCVPGRLVCSTTSTIPELSLYTGGGQVTRTVCVADDTLVVMSSGHWIIGGLVSSSSAPGRDWDINW